jgi:hypothetical protein
MAFDVAELKLFGIDVRNIDTIHGYEEYLKQCLPAQETIQDILIDVNREKLLSDLYLFTDGLMIEIPDFITYFDDKFHDKIMDFTIHPIKKGILFCNMKITGTDASDQHNVEVKFELKTGAVFSFSQKRGNANKLEIIAQKYLVPNLGTG